MIGQIIVSGICFFVAIAFLEIGVYFFLTRKPVFFRNDERICRNDVSDIRKYNRANGLAWVFTGIPYLVFIGFLICADIFLVELLIVVYSVAVIFILTMVNKRAKNKYLIKKDV